MKKFFAVAAALLIAVASFAQETNRDENGKLKFGGYETNKFWSNWTIGVGAGWNTTTSAPYWDFKKGHLGNMFDANNGFPIGTELFALKWIEPCYGVRFGWTGVKTVEAVNDVTRNFNYAHVDILWNWSNQFWGYKEGRRFNFSPYFTLAPYMRSVSSLSAGAGAGILTQFAFNAKWGLFFDLRGVLSDAHILGIPSDTYNFWSTTFGLSCNLGKSNWTRVSTSAAAAAAAIAVAEAAAAAKAAAAEKAAADAKAAADKSAAEAKQLADEAIKAAQAKGNIDGLFDEPVVVYFEIGQSKLTSAEKAHAEYAIKNILARGENVKFTLGGSADTKTGSAKRNKQLSEQRAKCVYNLIDELGVSRDNITVVEWDGKTQRFEATELNRAVIIDKQ